MPRKRDAQSQAKEIEELRQQVAELQRQQKHSAHFWVSAIGALLSGLAAVGLHANPTPPAPPTIVIEETISRTDLPHTPEMPSGDPPLGSLLNSLANSPTHRSLVANVFRNVSPELGLGLWQSPHDAKADLLDPKNSPDIRSLAALYFGAHPDLTTLLPDHMEVEDPLVQQAILVASQMHEDKKLTPVPTLAIPKK